MSRTQHITEITADLMKKIGQAREGEEYTPPQPARQPIYVTPFLKPEDQAMLDTWMSGYKMPAFVLATDNYRAKCQNCCDFTVIYARLCSKGPFSVPPGGMRAITWYQGDERFGKGWYIIEKSTYFNCPVCNADAVPLLGSGE